MKKLLLGSVFVLVFGLTGCDQSADELQRQQQEKISEQGNMTVGMPGISNFFEKRLMKTILEMRDDPAMVTYTYITDFNGHLHLRCNSIGYGLPYATQYTNPSKIDSTFSSQTHVLPQADPNGLFSPSAAEGTWVLCHDPKSNKNYPVYFEDRVTVSPFPLEDK